MKSWGHPWENRALRGAIYYVCIAIAKSEPDFLRSEDVKTCHRCGAPCWFDPVAYRDACRLRHFDLLVTCVRCANIIARRGLQ